MLPQEVQSCDFDLLGGQHPLSSPAADCVWLRWGLRTPGLTPFLTEDHELWFHSLISEVACAGWVQTLIQQEPLVPSAWLLPESRVKISLCLGGTTTVLLHGKDDILIRQVLTVTDGMGYSWGRIGDTGRKAWGVGSPLCFLRRGG